MHLLCVHGLTVSVLPAAKLTRNDKAMQNYKRMYLAPPEVPMTEENSPLLTNSVYKHIQVWSMQSSVVACSVSATPLPLDCPL